MKQNPYASPGTSSVLPRRTSHLLHRAQGAILAAIVGVPLGGVFFSLLFDWCYGIGWRVIADETYDSLQSNMFLYGTVVSLIPALACGALNHRRPICAMVATHVLGVSLAATLALCCFRWQVVMSAYTGLQLVLPIAISAVFVVPRYTTPPGDLAG